MHGLFRENSRDVIGPDGTAAILDFIKNTAKKISYKISYFGLFRTVFKSPSQTSCGRLFPVHYFFMLTTYVQHVVVACLVLKKTNMPK